MKLPIRIVIIICLIVILIDLINNLYQVVFGEHIIDNIAFFIIAKVSLVLVLIYTGYILLKK